MSLGISITAIFIAFISMILAGSFAISSADTIQQIANYSNSSQLQTAHLYMVWAVAVAWVTVVLIILLGLTILIYNHVITYSLSDITLIKIGAIVSLLIIGGSITTAYLGAIASIELNKNVGYRLNTNNNIPRRDAIISSVIAMLAMIAMLVYFIYSIINFNPIV